MYRRDSFIQWMEQKGYAINTRNTMSSQVGRADKFLNGIDEFIEKQGIDGTLSWVTAGIGEVFGNYPAQLKSAVRRYVEFLIGEKAGFEPGEQLEELVEEVAAPTALFSLEKEMQVAVRKQLQSLEPGLKVIDNGMEVQVDTGRIDILAEDAGGTLVVIELKVGRCPPGALEQTLGYVESLHQERKIPVRAFLVAGEFSDRLRAAAKRIGDVRLVTYQLALNFQTIG